MEQQIYNTLIIAMPILAVIVFIALFFVKAGYGIFQNKNWGISINNRLGWIIMECPVFFVMLYLWITGNEPFNPILLTFFLLFELHYFQRTFIFPFLMNGKSRMPLSIIGCGVLFNVINGYMQGEWLFHLAPEGYYTDEWFASPAFICGVIVFFAGISINLHSDHVIRHLRPKGDTRHYLPQKGFYKYVTSANYFGELVEWTGFAILTQSTAAWIFVLWTFANLAPRAYKIKEKYIKEFGADAVGKRKCLIPFIY